jgi:uncharacterized protein (TIGR03067 family)
MRKTSVLVLLFALFAPPARADEVDPEPPRSKSILGKWEFERVLSELPEMPRRGLVLTFEKDKLSVSRMGQRVDTVYTIKVDPRKEPAHLDIDDAERKKKIEGIYKIEKGELYLCIGERTGKRPTTFDGKDEVVIVLKKQAKK